MFSLENFEKFSEQVIFRTILDCFFTSKDEVKLWKTFSKFKMTLREPNQPLNLTSNSSLLAINMERARKEEWKKFSSRFCVKVSKVLQIV